MSERRPFPAKGSRWSVDEDARFRALVGQGASNKAIANALGRPYESVKSRRIALERTEEPRLRQWVPEDDKLLSQMVSGGATTAQMAEAFGRTESQVANHLHHLRASGKLPPSERARRFWTAEEERDLLSMAEEGVLADEMAAALGRT